MRKALAAATLIALPACVAPTLAHACTISIVRAILPDDPDEPGISAREKHRREAAVRAALAEQARAETLRLRSEAREGLARPSEAHARALVTSMVAPPVHIASAPCSGPSVTSRYRDYDTARAAVVAAAGGAGRYPVEYFAGAYAEVVRPCGEEMRDRLAAYAVGRVAPEKLARVWFRGPSARFRPFRH